MSETQRRMQSWVPFFDVSLVTDSDCPLALTARTLNSADTGEFKVRQAQFCFRNLTYSHTSLLPNPACRIRQKPSSTSESKCTVRPLFLSHRVPRPATEDEPPFPPAPLQTESHRLRV